MNRRLLILDDEPGVLDAYRIIFTPQTAAPMIASSRSRSGSAAVAAAPVTAPEAFEVSYLSTGEEALALIEKSLNDQQPLVGGFFDVKLGRGIDGIETIRRAKDLDPNLLCVMVTAYQDRNLDEITRLFGAEFADRWDFLTKPFSHNEILQKARNLCQNWDRRKREKEYLEQIQSQQEQLIRAERLAAMGGLARGIGHEFGNILLRIIGLGEIALQKNTPDDLRNALKVIVTAAERAGVIVRNLQGLVRMETKRELCDVHGPLREALPLVEHELKKGQIQLVEQFDATLPPVLINRVEIGQVFLNLIINAIHAMEGNPGTLKIQTHAEANGVMIDISDTGCGIPPENRDKIFEPLFTTKGQKGTGIGLSVTRKIITNHSGRVSVDSTVGKGTTFHLWLPKPS
jgi:signal transduction histidine kinase